jgi:hypothetical protein
MYARLDKRNMMSALATIGLGRVSWRTATFLFHACMQKNTYSTEIRNIYGYVLDGAAIAIGKVGMSDYMAYIPSIGETYNRFEHTGRPETTTVNSVVSIFHFNFNRNSKVSCSR